MKKIKTYTLLLLLIPVTLGAKQADDQKDSLTQIEYHEFYNLKEHDIS